MKAFAELLDRLLYTPSRNGKLTLMCSYFRRTPDPDRGYALAALTDGLPYAFPIRRVIVELAANRFDPELYRLSRDYVGDTAETLSLMWPPPPDARNPPRLADIVERLKHLGRTEQSGQLALWLDQLDVTGRWALLKFLSGAPRVGVSARLARLAVAQTFGRDVTEIEELWHGLEPPFLTLFSWLEGRTGLPKKSTTPVFRPLMLAHPLEDADWDALDIADFAVEWKWDGIRVQLSGRGGVTRLFSRTGDDVGQAFPDVIEGPAFDAVLDGELLVMREGIVAPFGDLQ
ncbi:MAG: ATP-dependent DNA ligase, partial [Rhizobiales bacterium]|nr:ATP-dependent DNA ligase [Hyphomicrobiales bacterium]